MTNVFNIDMQRNRSMSYFRDYKGVNRSHSLKQFTIDYLSPSKHLVPWSASCSVKAP